MGRFRLFVSVGGTKAQQMPRWEILDNTFLQKGPIASCWYQQGKYAESIHCSSTTLQSPCTGFFLYDGLSTWMWDHPTQRSALPWSCLHRHGWLEKPSKGGIWTIFGHIVQQKKSMVKPIIPLPNALVQTKISFCLSIPCCKYWRVSLTTAMSEAFSALVDSLVPVLMGAYEWHRIRYLQLFLSKLQNIHVSKAGGYSVLTGPKSAGATSAFGALGVMTTTSSRL